MVDAGAAEVASVAASGLTTGTAFASKRRQILRQSLYSYFRRRAEYAAIKVIGN